MGKSAIVVIFVLTNGVDKETKVYIILVSHNLDFAYNHSMMKVGQVYEPRAMQPSQSLSVIK